MKHQAVCSMTEPEINNNPLPKKKRRHWGRYLLITLFLLITGIFFFFFFGFKYFGEQMLRQYLQEKVFTASRGLYYADFRNLQLNIITGKLTIDSLEVIPDSARYEQLKATGMIKKALYRFSLASLTIDRLHAWQIFRLRRVNLRQIILKKPVISIVGFPDTATAQRNRIKIIYEDIYPSISEAFNDFHVDSVKMEHGLFLSSFRQKTGRLSEGEYEFSSTLRNVSVNPFSYYNHDRVFYSRDIDFVIYDFEYALADSLYFLKAKEAGFSLSGSRLYGKMLSLRPNFKSNQWRQMKTGNFYAFELPSFSINGINMYSTLVDKTVKVGNIEFSDLFLKVYHNKSESDALRNKKTRKKQLTTAGLYTIIAGILRSVEVDTIKLNKATFEYYGKITEKYPELRIGTVNLNLTKFFLDSLAWQNKKKIFFAKDLELDLKKFSLRLQDGIHTLDAGQVSISTLQSEIRLKSGLLSPNISKNLLLTVEKKNTVSLLLPELVFHDVDLKLLFNYRIFEFKRLDIHEPDVKVTRFREPRNKDPRFKKPGDFFQAENENVVYELLKKYVQRIHGEQINIRHGYGQLARNDGNKEQKIASASFDLLMEQFLIDSVHGMNQEGYFYSRDFDLDLHSVFLESPDSLRRLQVGRIHIITTDSLIESENLSLIESAQPLKRELRNVGQAKYSVEFTLKSLHLTGLNHKRLFLDKTLKATKIVIETPSLRLKAEPRFLIEGPMEEKQHLTSDELIRSLEIGRLIVRKGAFSYDGYEDRKASYFSLKDIDFSVVHSRVHIPQEGMYDGSIRFDSLQLSVFPFRAILADSTYVLEIRSLGVYSYPVNLMALGLKLFPITPSTAFQGKNNLVTATIPELRINGFYFDRAVFDKEWLVNQIVMDEPSVFIDMKIPDKKTETTIHPSPPFSLPPFMKVLDIRSILIKNALAEVKTEDAKGIHQYKIKDVDIKATRVLFDSTSRDISSLTPLFNVRDITLQAPGISWISDDSLYTYSFQRFGFSTQQKNGFIDSISVIPNYNRVDFSRKRGYQTDRIIFSIPRLELDRIDYQKLIGEKQLKAGILRVKGMKIEDYRDKRVPFPIWQRPLMPQSAIRKIQIPLQIDTLSFQNGFAAYEEQTAEIPGRVFFNNINGTLTGFDTRKELNPAPLILHSTLALMGKAPSETWLQFFMNHPRDSFTFRASVGMLDLQDLNPMLSRLMPISITRGKASHTEIDEIYGNDSMASGLLHFYYQNFAIQLEQNPDGIKSSLERTLLTAIANMVVSSQNPNEDGKIRTGTIYFKRDQSKGFFNLVWKSIFSGLKSTYGMNTKKQREIRRNGKKMLK
ncbi:MAG: DUF748 domain-containing protein [Bacteroidales bacterium]|nr:DUF748 domain-containing protein [Bacteroidales bacterium]